MTMRPVKDDQAIEPAWDDAPTGVGGASYGGSLPNVSPNNRQDTHATSADMCEQIMAGIDRQLRLAIEDGDGDIAVSKPSKTGLFNFAKMHKITRAPFIVLQDNGNLSASWTFDNNEEFNLTFLRNGSLNYVAFLNRTGGVEAILHGNDTIDGVIKFIQSNEIIL